MVLMEVEIQEHLSSWLILFCLFGYKNIISAKWMYSDCHLFKRLLDCQNLALGRGFILLLQTKQSRDIEAKKAAESNGNRYMRFWLDIYNEWYIHQFQPRPTNKYWTQVVRVYIKDMLPWKISSIITNTIPVSTRII